VAKEGRLKFCVAIATRGNPKRAAAVLECAKSLSSGEHDIEFVIGCDADDTETYNYFRSQYPGVYLSVDARSGGVGAVWNRSFPKVEADIYCPFPDDSWIASPGWDEIIAREMRQIDDWRLGVLAWRDLANRGQCTLPIVTREWLDVTGKLYDERFPFWFYDTCVDELYSFITGRRVKVVDWLLLSARKGVTKRMRDVAFWWNFYEFSRVERLVRAAEIRKAIGIDLPDRAIELAVDTWRARDVRGRSGISEIERLLVDHTHKPDETYQRAFSAAKDIMGQAA
jgi:glycosyltransferase involved in cell wall biosynthesis